MSSRPIYWIEFYNEAAHKWQRQIGTLGTKQYCLGYIDAINSLYPSPSARIVKSTTGLDSKDFEVIEQIKKKSAPHCN